MKFIRAIFIVAIAAGLLYIVAGELEESEPDNPVINENN
jgi:hypothetical protein